MLKVNTVTVIGANGAMGRNISAIFASFGNAKVYMISRDIRKSEQAKENAYQSVRAESVKENMIPADYSMLEQCIIESDVIFESLSEDFEIKIAMTKRIAEIAENNIEKCTQKVFCTGTSGLSITKLAEIFPIELRKNYIGMHMFNPPYTMTLCEIIPTKYSKSNLFYETKKYCREVLHRTVVEVKDSPAFLGNRIGFQFINEAMQCAETYKYNGGIDYIDSILGSFTGRTMAPLVTSNFVGLDVHKAIVNNLYENTEDFANKTFILPDYVEKLIEQGHLGKKSGVGLYKTVVHDSGIKIHQVYDIESNSYRNVMKYTFPFVESMILKLREGDYSTAFRILEKNFSSEAELCCKFLIKYVLYALKSTELVSYSIHSADDVMASGFNWCPPLALIEAFGGVENFASLCQERMEKEILDEINLKDLMKKVESSKYDFRKFIRAKR